jgi:hypothetical protein
MTVFWVVAPCSLVDVYRLHHQGDDVMVEAASTSETSVNYQTTRRNISEASDLHTRRRQNLKFHQGDNDIHIISECDFSQQFNDLKDAANLLSLLFFSFI